MANTSLGFEEESLNHFLKALKNPFGIILVTGPTGSGKTTTLYAALNEINDPGINITTAEDPVEYSLMGINQLQVNESIGLTFASALRAYLRQDPDVIMVGEIRDKTTTEIAIRAALTGHLVLSTVHTNSAAATITRLINMGVEPFLIASTIIVVVSQRLVRKICTSCKTPLKISDDDLVKYGFDPQVFKGKEIFHGIGCNKCKNTGYSGRIGLFEVLPVTKRIGRMLLKDGVINETQLQTALKRQRELGGRIGTHFIELGYVNEKTLVNYLSKQYEVPGVALSEFPLDKDILDMIPPEFAQKFNVIPLKREGKYLTVAMINPKDVFAIDAIRFRTGLDIKPVVACEKSIKKILEEHYKTKALEDEVMEEMGLEDAIEVVEEEEEERFSDLVAQVDDGTSFLDFDEDEVNKRASINVKVATFDRGDVRINLIDTPGYIDFASYHQEYPSHHPV